MSKQWLERMRAAFSGNEDAHAAVLEGLRHEETGLWEVLCTRAGVAELEACRTRPSSIDDYIRPGLEAGEIWARRLLAAGLDVELTWARRLFLDALKAGHEWALVMYRERYHHRVQQICRRILVYDEEAEELADEILLNFLDVYVHRDKVLETFPGYLLRTARTQAIKRKQRLARESGRNTRDGALDPTDEEPLVEDRLSHDAALRIMRAARVILSREEDEIVRLRHELDMTNAAIGKEFSVSHQAIAQRLNRIYKKLREHMDELDPERGR